MKRKIITIIVSLIFCMTLALPAAAMDGGEHPPRLVDEAELLTGDEESSLVDKLDAVSDKWQCDVTIVTVDSLGSKTDGVLLQHFACLIILTNDRYIRRTSTHIKAES